MLADWFEAELDFKGRMKLIKAKPKIAAYKTPKMTKF
jgi:hypothetical protein